MISKRIKEIAKLANGFKRIADIGCDHGYLIIEAFQKYNIEFAQAVDNKPMPLAKAKENIVKYSFYKNVCFTLADGLDSILNVDCIFICGMGGNTIINILENNLSKINDEVLILQPNRNTYEVRKFLEENSFVIIDEKIIKDEFFYEVIIARKGKYHSLTEEERIYGPINMTKKDAIFIEKMNNDLEVLNKINIENEEINKKKNIIRRIINECK